MNTRAIIIGSGYSIRNNDHISKSKDLEVFKRIKNECTFGLNYCYQYFKPTIACFVDFQFYIENKKDLDKLGLIIGKYDPQLKEKIKLGSNLFLFIATRDYHTKQGLKKGLYSGKLVGLFALSLAIALDFKEIYLLGYDATGLGPNFETHFYQNEINLNKKGLGRLAYGGVGRNKLRGGNFEYPTNPYNKKNCDNYFKPFINTSAKIFNVSKNSHISEFPKITHAEFYSIIEKNPSNISQSLIRNSIIQRIKNV